MSLSKWKKLGLKTRIAYITAVVAFVVGWGLTIAAFFYPPIGIIHESVLWVLGQALLYAASVLGIGMYVTGQVRSMRNTMDRYIRHTGRPDPYAEMDFEEVSDVYDEGEDGNAQI
jgi:hypothetical protein